MIFVYFFFWCLTFALILFAIFFGILTGDSFFGKYDFPTNKFAIKAAAGIIKAYGKQKGILCDLGSARGNFALKVSSYCPELRIVGTDDNFFRIFVSRLRALFLNRVRFLKGDLFSAKVAEADIVYIYLEKDLMPSLEKKLSAEMKPGSLVISNASAFPNWQPKQVLISDPSHPTKQKLFVYVKS